MNIPIYVFVRKSSFLTSLIYFPSYATDLRVKVCRHLELYDKMNE